MTDILREIEKGYEAKYKLDEELHFKAMCRSHKMFGLWAADHLGHDGQQAEEFAMRMVRLTLEQKKVDAVVDTVAKEFADAGVHVPAPEVAAAYHRFYAIACEQIGTDYPTPLGTDHEQVGG